MYSVIFLFLIIFLIFNTASYFSSLVKETKEEISNPLKICISFSSYWNFSGLSLCVKYLYAPLILSNRIGTGELTISAIFLAAVILCGPSQLKITCQCDFFIVPSAFVSLLCKGDTAKAKCVSCMRSIQSIGAESG